MVQQPREDRPDDVAEKRDDQEQRAIVELNATVLDGATTSEEVLLNAEQPRTSDLETHPETTIGQSRSNTGGLESSEEHNH